MIFLKILAEIMKHNYLIIFYGIISLDTI